MPAWTPGESARCVWGVILILYPFIRSTTGSVEILGNSLEGMEKRLKQKGPKEGLRGSLSV